MTNTYRFADVNVQVTAVYPAIQMLCSGYETDGTVDFTVDSNQADIDCERSRADHPGYSDAYLETLAVYRKIAEKMPDYDTFLFHGSCIAVDGAGYLFTAKSGTGKSTHARLWRELLGDRAAMINDDKPLIHLTEGAAIVYGKPWDGKHHLSSNIAVPLRAVCIFERAAENHIREIAPSEALPMLLQQVYRPMNAAAMEKTLHLIDRLAGCVKLYRLGCNMDIRAAKLSYHTMKG